ncbi:Uncharacterized protein PRO82_001285 [Candidatus Protochlamydia amoebophila]|uniref:hypothetical protein n=1 Tax=Candidatus Protochlamydia amoebophila TaxID=362787 RepID=UPI001BC8D6C0|nr:hypothetical protein [Candidatus Protochlamydia amoebophila]MBS4163976.1 Uncharacterized protein [Candidatus Protochlamydia amoebophila]
MLFNRSFNIGFFLLAIYLILVGLVSIVKGLDLPPLLMGILALLSGIFILMRR